MTKEEVIAALEKAEGPDRALDSAIYAELRLDGWTPEEWAVTLADPEFINPTIPGVAAYTASIDAALTLVPQRCDMITFRSDPSGSGWELGEFTGGEYIKHSEGVTGGLWAIALCLAALRARA